MRVLLFLSAILTALCGGATGARAGQVVPVEASAVVAASDVAQPAAVAIAGTVPQAAIGVSTETPVARTSASFAPSQPLYADRLLE